MSDIRIQSIQDEIRGEVEQAIRTWQTLLEEVLGECLLALYAKGSAIKPWDSEIDYVPQLSDVDLHVLTSLDGGLFDSAGSAFDQAMRLSKAYEARFRAALPDAHHVPRTQIVVLNDVLDDKDFVVSPRVVIRLLRGEVPEPSEHGPEELHRLDRKNLLALDSCVDGVPSALADRSGLDLWTIVRRMTWRVSPSPVRLLSLASDDPLEVWSWNRTRVAKELERAGYEGIAASWRAWYRTGWDLFRVDFRDADLLRELIGHGHRVLEGCLAAVRSE